MRSSRFVSLRALRVAIWIGAGDAMAAPSGDLTRLSLEELSKVRVTTAARQSQPLLEVAAPVSVIGADLIELSGQTTLPEMLRRAPGVDVGQITSSIWGISSRGLNGQYANRQLVLLDNRQMYSTLFGGVYWDAVNPFMPDVEQIEVVRGPGGSQWGANAVHGVINILTKPADETQGGLLKLSVGTEDYQAGVRYGFEIGLATFARVTASHAHHEPSEGAAGNSLGDGWEANSFEARVDHYADDWSYVFQAGVRFNTLGQQFLVGSQEAPYFELVRDPIESDGAYLSIRGQQVPDENGSSTDWMVYWDETDISPFVVNERRRSFHGYLHRMQSVGERHMLDLRAESRLDQVDFRRTRFVRHYDDHPNEWTNGLSAGIAKKEISGDPLNYYAGARFERHERLDDWLAMPHASVSYRFVKDTLIWGSFTRAARAPDMEKTDLETDIRYFPPGFVSPGAPAVQQISRGNRNLDAERYEVFEVGLRRSLGQKLNLDLSAYYQDEEDLVGRVTGPIDLSTDPGTQYIDKFNDVSGQVSGYEVNLDYAPTADLLARLHYGFIDQDLAATIPGLSMTEIGGLAKHQAFIEFSHRAAERFQYQLFARYASGRSLGMVDSFLRVDATLRWQATPSAAISLSGENLAGDGEVEMQNFNTFESSRMPRRWRLSLESRF